MVWKYWTCFLTYQDSMEKKVEGNVDFAAISERKKSMPTTV